MQEWPNTWVNESSYVFREKKTQKWLTIYEDKKTVQLECAVCGWRVRRFIGDDMHKECPNIKNHPKEEKKMKSALDTQVGGSHYKNYKIQPYEFFFANKIPHHKAAIMRRILRYDHETGKGLEDLEKIRHEIALIIELEGWDKGEEE